MAGRIQAVPKGMISAIPLVKSGKARVIAILQSQRASALPGIRTAAEMGATDYEYPSWIGIIGAASTPPAITGKLSAALARGVKSAKSMQTWEQLGVNPVGSTPDEFRRILARETEHWKKFVSENNIRGE
jgi:tripartite-type tricarboxylate transporter receptor subunit TctC